jgi:hypothetical protein
LVGKIYFQAAVRDVDLITLSASVSNVQENKVLRQNVDCQNIACQNVDCQNIACQNVDCQNIACQNVDCQNMYCLSKCRLSKYCLSKCRLSKHQKRRRKNVDITNPDLMLIDYYLTPAGGA